MSGLLTPYDASWPEQFERVAAQLRSVGDPTWVIEHIGSTSIPGMRAKPIIDVAVRIRDITEFEEHRQSLESSGWRVGSGVRTHPVMVFEQDERRVQIVHFFAEEQWDTANQRILRDWLRTNPADAAHYEDAKIAAEQAARSGASTYNGGKTAVIQEILDRARAARGLPQVSAYDK
ncbi:GrpB family protein [Microbacterium sp. LTA6]|uniref:GrpB family protein n=1 Tax=unclassified Microbacterium TaxID=2609290 RepID=UPI00313A0C51